MNYSVATIETPVAPWTVVVDPDGVVIASGFSSEADTLARLTDEQRALGVRRVRDLGGVMRAMESYLGGEVDALDDVPVSQPGGPFQQQVWTAMRGIVAGQTWSYAELATKAGRPAATRAVGTACARNLVAPFVPCHRVVKSDGTLGGYYYGLPVKEWLLRHEQR
ncbi:MAG: methylated-DNA--[protein]-cysteine S-methyltransferase [Actinomycetes bacterium]